MDPVPRRDSKHARQLGQLRRLIAGVDTHGLCKPQRTDDSPLGRLIGGGRSHTLVDCLGESGSGVSLVALWLCQRAAARRGELVVVDPSGDFYPPAAAAWGVDLQRLIVARPSSNAEALAAADVALRSPAVSAVWARVEGVDDRSFRRLLLATEAGKSFATLVRPTRHRSQASWADVQLQFEPIASPCDPEAPFLVQAIQVRNRHGPAGCIAVVRLDWRSGRIEAVEGIEGIEGVDGGATNTLRVAT